MVVRGKLLILWQEKEVSILNGKGIFFLYHIREWLFSTRGEGVKDLVSGYSEKTSTP